MVKRVAWIRRYVPAWLVGSCLVAVILHPPDWLDWLWVFSHSRTSVPGKHLGTTMTHVAACTLGIGAVAGVTSAWFEVRKPQRVNKGWLDVRRVTWILWPFAAYAFWASNRWETQAALDSARRLPYPDDLLILFHDALDSLRTLPAGKLKMHGEIHSVMYVLQLTTMALVAASGWLLGKYVVYVVRVAVPRDDAR